jgi:hypothetical protein
VVDTINNLWVLIAALLVFTMTISVGFLEVGELGEELDFSLLKTILMTGLALVVMAFVGFNTAFAPTAGGLIGHPFYSPGFFLGGFSTKTLSATSGVWWSMRHAFFNTGLTTATYFFFRDRVRCRHARARRARRLAQGQAGLLRRLLGRLLHPDLEPACGLDLEPDRLARPPRHGRLRRWARRARRGRRSRTRDPLPDLARGARAGPADEPASAVQAQPGLADALDPAALGRLVVWRLRPLAAGL